MSNVDLKAVRTFIKDRAQSKEYRDFMVKLLRDLIDIENTTTARPLPQIVANEKKAFDVLENALRPFVGSEVKFERSPITPDIEKHPYYTRAYYTADEKHPMGLPAAGAYRDRFNLLALVTPPQKSAKGSPMLLNAHIDTVSPFYPSKVDDTNVHGRGACDDKGSVVALAASLKLLAEVRAKFGPIPAQPSVYQFVIEEEPGGNGSLSAALDERFKGYEAVICEATISVPLPANRGAMWFQMDLDTAASKANTAEIIPFIVHELAQFGQQLRKETNLPLFPKQYIQANFGSLGGFGRHPSAVNDYIAYEFTVDRDAAPQIDEAIRAGLAAYCQSYADRTKETQPETGQPKLKQHYQLTPLGQGRYKLEIFGIGGHMGAMLLCDNALIKTGYIMQSLITALRGQAGLKVEFRLAEDNFNPLKLTMTGGIGFAPSHKMLDLQKRAREAAVRGIQRYNAVAHASATDQIVNLTFDKLHNEAYASPVDCPAMKAFHAAYDAMGLDWPTPIAFRASCDARIYGNSGHNTVTFGPGHLADAHSDHEKISIAELHKGLEMVTLTTLALTTGQDIG